MPGNYHFRFKSPLIPGSDREKNAVSVWMDCVNDDQHVGVWRNSIVAKVTRINMEDDFPRQRQPPIKTTATSSRTNAASNVQQHRPPVQHHQQQQQLPGQAPQRHAVPPKPMPTAASDNLLGLDGPIPSTTSAAPAPNGSLLDVDNHHHNSHNIQSAPSTEGSLLDMNGPTATSTYKNTNSHDDFLGMTSAPVSTTAAPPTPAPTPIPAAPSSYGMPLPGSGANPPKPKAPLNTFSKKAGPFGGLEW